MKAKYKIFNLVLSFLLFWACQKKEENRIEYKNKIIVVLDSLAISNQKEAVKEKVLDTLSQYILTKNNDSISRNLLFKVANKYYFFNKSDKYLTLSKSLLELSTEKEDTVHIAKSLYYLGDYYNSKSQFDSAFSYYNKSEKLYKTLKDTLNLGLVSLLKGGILFETGNFSEAETESVRALRLLLKAKNKDMIFNCYNVIAISLKELNNYEKSLEYFDLALLQLKKLENEKYPKETIEAYRISCYNNIGRVYEKMKNYKEAIYYYNLGLQTKNIKKDYPKPYALILDNLAYSKMKTGDLKDVERMLFESLKIRDSLGVELGSASSKVNNRRVLSSEKRYDKRIGLFKR